MGKRKRRNDGLADIIRQYAGSCTLDLIEFTDIHFRLTDDYTVMDIWPTTGKYYISKTSYFQQTTKRITERAGEKGTIPFGTTEINTFLDGIYFAAEIED